MKKADRPQVSEPLIANCKLQTANCKLRTALPSPYPSPDQPTMLRMVPVGARRGDLQVSTLSTLRSPFSTNHLPSTIYHLPPTIYHLPHSRRGVLLLVVLGLLAMFGLVAVAFVIISGQAQRSAKIMQRIDQTLDQPQKLLNEAMMQVARGPSNPVSVMGSHSLLEDIYGNTARVGAIDPTLPNTVVGGQLIQIGVPLPIPPSTKGSLPALRLSDAPQRSLSSCPGMVITFLNGPRTMGRSTRIVSWVPENPSGVPPQPNFFQIVATDQITLANINADLADLGVEPLFYLINGVPFSGTGFGYNSASGQLNALDFIYGFQLGLQPNAPQNRALITLGGANEDYDAADFQNMALAAQIGINTIPSMHRPALVNYWYNRLVTDASLEPTFWNSLGLTAVQKQAAIMYPYGQDFIPGTADDSVDWPFNKTVADKIIVFKRNILLRPLREDNSEFTGSNMNPTGFNPLNPPWDVDNDGDGVPDSIWVDLGLPVRAAKDGKLYKPLFAILCVDMDGRLNLNAHGNQAQLSVGYYGQINNLNWAGGSGKATLNRGVGFGPAEINLAPIFSNLFTSNPPTQTDLDNYYKPLLSGTGSLPGRYGAINPSSSEHLLSWNKLFQYRNSYWDFQSALNTYLPSAYGSPPDFDGGGSVGLDLAGRPLYLGMGLRFANNLDIATNPYELDLSFANVRGPFSSPDNPFSVNELERILRPYDRDTTLLPNRLSVLAPSLIQKRHIVTTESWDVPCSATTQSIADMMIAKGATPDQLTSILPPELLMGLKMNINCPLGNGSDQDDPSSSPHAGVVDYWDINNLPTKTADFYFNAITHQYFPIDPKSHVSPPPPDPRQIFARYLYILTSQLVDLQYLRGQLGSDENVARYLAQWAVNVVDFCDRDSIMTRFDYDSRYVIPPNPPVTLFPTDWNPSWDGNQYIVWGCERPELLISETLAFHDRRTQDTDADGGKVPPAVPTDIHNDFDQIVPPQGSLFIELYNPWGPNESPAGEFGAFNRASGKWDQSGCVKLNQPTPQGHPVWRLAIVTPANANLDPDDPDPTQRPAIERSVYFVNPIPAGITGDGQVQYYTNANIAPILPGRYAVIGPSDDTTPGATPAVTHIGTRIDGVVANTRRIELNPNVNPNQDLQNNPQDSQVKVVWNNGSVTNDLLPNLPTVNIKPPVAVVIDQSAGAANQRLNVSEPTLGYPALSQDQPWDRLVVNPDFNLMTTGTQTGYRVVHLQRLANPLMPWNNTPTNPNYNPYVTIDSQPIDITVFNGLENDSTDTSVIAGTVMFASHQRGETNQGSDGLNNLWKLRLDQKPSAATPNGSGDHMFDHILQHTLGFLNNPPFGSPRTGADPTTDPYSYRGDPQSPFPWLTWNNRPFASSMELLLVPALRSSQLLRMYDPAQGTNDYATFQGNYPHLLNFLMSPAAGAMPGTATQFYKLFDYVYVPSWFVGTEIQGNPNFMTGGTHLFHPPFNFIPTYREPGRVNLNTIYSQEVFKGLLNRPDLSNGGIWDNYQTSRQGLYATNPSGCPSEFGNPFRSASNAFMVPLDTIKTAIGREIDATLLRKDPNNPNQPLFRFDSNQDSNNAQRNPYFYYQEMQRLSNLVTTRSNVYSVWITVGYFEVKPKRPNIFATPPETVPGIPDPAHPDGYELGQELGSDTGEIVRHRAFYMIDRTIPVGFLRGQDLNVEKAIILKRFIE